MAETATQIVPVSSPDAVQAKPKIDPNLNLLQVLNQILAMNPPKTDIKQATPDQDAAAKVTGKQSDVKPVDPQPVAAKESARRAPPAAMPDVVPMQGMGDPVAAAGNAIQAAAAAGAQQQSSGSGIMGIIDSLKGGKGGGDSKGGLGSILKIAALFI